MDHAVEWRPGQEDADVPSRPVDLPSANTLPESRRVSILKGKDPGPVGSLDPLDDEFLAERPKALEADHLDFVAQKTRRVVCADTVPDEETTELVGKLRRHAHVPDVPSGAPNRPRDRLDLAPHVRSPGDRRIHINARARCCHAHEPQPTRCESVNRYRD
jgi:hypothetical protein